jgi:thiol-disulfide isomerase/thioredoxin
MKRFRIGVLIAAIILLPVSVAAVQSHEVASPLNAVTSQKEWLNTERPLTSDDLAGRVVLLDFWTYCCINCMHVIPDLHYLEEKFGEKLTVVGVHSAKFVNERDSENIRQAMLRYDITHPVVNDDAFDVWKAFDIHAWPSFVLIDPAGKIVKHYSGEGHRAALEQDISQLIAEAGNTLKTDALPIALEKNKEPKSVLNFPAKLDIAADVEGEPMLFVSDSGNHRIVGMRLDGQIVMQIGSGEQGMQDGGFDIAAFHNPQGILWDEASNTLFIADTENHALRAADVKKKTVRTLAGNGMQGRDRRVKDKRATEVPLASPWDLAFYPDHKHIAIAMAGTHQLWEYDVNRGTVSVIAGSGRESIDDGKYPLNSLSQPSGLATLGTALYFVDAETSSLRRLANNTITTLIGTGLFDFGYAEGSNVSALMQHPLGVFADESGVYIADSYNHAIRFYDPQTAILSNYAGTGARGDNDGATKDARFNEPNDVIGWQGNYYVADTNNHRIRMIDREAHKVQSLDVMPMSAPIAYDPDLPEAQKQEDAVIRPSGVTLGVSLEKGWKINEQAPTYLALFTNKEPHNQIAVFERDAVANGVVLPKLELGAEYILQGTIYYCEDKKGSACLIASIEKTLTVTNEGERSLLVPVQ